MQEEEEDPEQAVLNWVNTFSLSKPCSNLSELYDGRIIIAILNEISPNHFDIESITVIEQDNWIVASTNIKRILNMLDEFYRDTLSKTVDTSFVNINGIVKDKDPDEIINLLEFIVGAAMFCENRIHFISVISQLEAYPQLFLKSLTESFMGRMVDLGSSDDADHDDKRSRELADDLMRSDEANRHLREEKSQLLQTVSELERSNDELQKELERLTTHAKESERDMGGWEYGNKSAANNSSSADRKAEQLILVQMELDGVKRDLDLELVKNDQLRSDFSLEKSKLQRKVDECNEMITRLTMDVQMMTDEVEVARDKSVKLARVETQLEKYQQKLEEMAALKKQNKELSDKLDQYLDQMHELETQNKNLQGYQKKAEEYRERAVKAENETTKANSASAVQHTEIEKLRSELENALTKKSSAERECDSLRIERNRLEDELQSQTAELEAAKSEGGRGGDRGFGSSGSAGSSSGSSSNLGNIYDESAAENTVPSLKEKVKKLELELDGYRKSSTGLPSSTANSALLEAEIAQLNKQDKEREEVVVFLRQQLKEAQLELQSTSRALKESEENHRNAITARDTQRKLDEALITLQIFEKNINDKDGELERLREEKKKLEEYLKKSLSSFKDRFKLNLDTLKKDKLAQEEKIRLLSEKLEANQETARREERLLLSSMYELGMKIMDRNFQAQMMDSNSSKTFLGMQRNSIEGEITKAPGSLY